MTLAGIIITKDYGTWTNTFTIDKGSEEGMAVNMAVVVPSGVVGFITDVYPLTLLEYKPFLTRVVQSVLLYNVLNLAYLVS